MVTKIAGNHSNQYFCLSTDTKPTDGSVVNASILFEMDTGKVFFYDEENTRWLEQ